MIYDKYVKKSVYCSKKYTKIVILSNYGTSPRS